MRFCWHFKLTVVLHIVLLWPTLALSQRCQVLTIAHFLEVVREKLDVDGCGPQRASAMEEVGSHTVTWTYSTISQQDLDAHQVRMDMLQCGKEGGKVNLNLILACSHNCQKLAAKYIFVIAFCFF